MPQDEKKNKSINVESLLSVKDKVRLNYLKDVIIHAGDNPALVLIGVDSDALGEAFVKFIRENLPVPVKRHDFKTKEEAFNVLKYAELLERTAFQVLCFFKNDSLPSRELASRLLFYRDYIPQYKLKTVIISSHELLNTIIGKAYDFYSISSFSGLFTDLSQLVQNDFEEYEGTPEAVLEFEKHSMELENYRKQENVVPQVLLKKLFRTAFSAQKISELETAQTLSEEALELAKQLDSKEYQGAILGNLGLIYTDKGRLNKALELHKRALSITQEIGDFGREASQLGNIGNIFFDKGDFDTALKFYRESLEMHRKIGDYDGEALQLGNIGNICAVKGELDQALRYNKEAVDIIKKSGDLTKGSKIIDNIGKIYFDKGELDEALKYFEEALELAKKTGDLRVEAANFYNIGRIYHKRCDFVPALICYKKTLEIAQKAGFKKIVSTARKSIEKMEKMKIGRREETRTNAKEQ